MNKTGRFFITVTVYTLSFILLTGCSMDGWVEVRGGDYVPVDAEHSHESLNTDPVISMHIDREFDSVTLTLADGSVIKTSFTERSKDDCPSGCPANLGSTRMEVLDLELSEIVLGAMVVNNPILVRNCPDNPERIILRQDGHIGGAGTACAQDQLCIHFKYGRRG